MSAAYLLLEDGTRFDGDAAGATGVDGLGEVVFNTSMSGYQEAVSDPSYAGQIIVFTYPLIGNYGVAEAHMESDRIHARAVIMREGVDREDAAHAEGGWLTWLADCGVPALSGVDTRALVRHIRDKGAMRGGVFAAELPEARGARAARGRAADERAATWRATSRRPSRMMLPGRGPARGGDRHRHQELDRAQPARARRAPGAAALHRERGRTARPRPRRGLPRQRAGRPGGARLRGRERARAGGQGARLGHLPRPPAALPRGRARDLQAAVRPPRRQPSGQGPRDRADRDHLAEPRLRRARPGRRAHDRERRAGALGDRLRHRRAAAAQPLRPHRRGPGAARRARLDRAVPPRGGPGAARRAAPLRPLPRAPGHAA